MIRLIIFDLSDTCFTSEEPVFLKKFIREHNLVPDKFEKAYLDLVLKAEVNKISARDAWNSLFKKFDIDDDFRRIIRDMMSFKEPTEVLGLAKSLKSKYKTAYLTNYCKEYWEEAEKRFDLKPYFDFGIASYQIGFRKPDPEGFLRILDHFKVKPGEAVFIDDSLKNLAAPKRLGIHVIQFKNKKQLTIDLRKKGVKV